MASHPEHIALFYGCLGAVLPRGQTPRLILLIWLLQVTDFLGSAAFSQAVQAVDIKTGNLVCLKIIKVSPQPLNPDQLPFRHKQ